MLETMLTATVTNVTTKQVVSKRTQQPITLWLVQTSDGTEWSTNRADIGNAALQLTGQVVDITGSVKNDGTYTNYYVNSIKANPSAQPSPVAQAAATAQAAQEANKPVSFDQYAALEKQKLHEKNRNIFRQTACKVAASLSSPDDPAEEFWSNVDHLMVFFITGRTPFTPTANHQADMNPGTISVTSHIGDTDDDIPF
jgi:hypothetical protein